MTFPAPSKGIQFDRFEAGGFLHVKADGSLGTPPAIELSTHADAGGAAAPLAVLKLGNAGGVDSAFLGIDTAGSFVAPALELDDAAGSEVALYSDISAGPRIVMNDTAPRTIEIVAGDVGPSGSIELRTGQMGFFDTAPVTRPAAPVTLADVIAALKALGLVAP